MSLDKFRLAIFGDFTGRAARGIVEIGPELANRRAIKLDVGDGDCKQFDARFSLSDHSAFCVCDRGRFWR